MAVIYGTDKNFKELVQGKTIVDFFATWCGPCKMLSPVIEELSKETDINFVKMDVDECPNISKEYGIMSVPTLLKFVDGKAVDSQIGYMNKNELLDWIQR